MSDVTVSVGGRNYTLACADGQEDNVRRLAGVVDGKIEAMGPNRSTLEAKSLLFAALLLADELDEARGAAPAPPRGGSRARSPRRPARTDRGRARECRIGP